LEKKLLSLTLCNFTFSTTFVRNIFHLKKNSAINVETYSCNVPVIPVGFYSKIKFHRHVFEKFEVLSFIKIRPVAAELFHADRRTKIMNLIAAFRKFASASENKILWQHISSRPSKSSNVNYVLTWILSACPLAKSFSVYIFYFFPTSLRNYITIGDTWGSGFRETKNRSVKMDHKFYSN
jgi:hypothetical protein